MFCCYALIRGVRLFLFATLMLFVSSCGGGSNGSSGSPDFTLVSSTNSVGLQQLGIGVIYRLDVTPINGFTNQVSVTFTNVPAGILILPAGPYTASPGQPLVVNLGADASAAIGNSSITVKATSGSITHSSTLAISVAAAVQFQLDITPGSVTLGPNSSVTTQITLTPGANFGSNSVVLSYPSTFLGNTHVQIALSSQFLSPAQPQATITLTSSFEQSAASNIPVKINGAVGGKIVSASFALNTTNPAPACSNPSRSTVQRTDMDVTGVVYDPVHKLVFAAVDQTNTVHVYASGDGHNIGTIDIPSARQLDITPDGSRLLVGSQTRYLTWVDPTTLQVVGQVAVDSSIFNGVLPVPLTPVILANGKVLLMAASDSVPVEWDPATNTYTNIAPTGLSGSIVVNRSGDHSKVVVLGILGSSLAVFDSATNSFGPVQNIHADDAALNFDGSKLAVIQSSPTLPGGSQIALYDNQFNLLATFQVNSLAVAGTLVFSHDGTKLYVLTGGFTIVLSATDLSYLGTVPGPSTNTGAQYPPDIDDTGMIFVPGNNRRALLFVDGSTPCAMGSTQTVNVALTPHQGTVSSPTPTVVNSGQGLTPNSLIYFGASPASGQGVPGTNFIYNSPSSVQVTPPSATASGPVNVTVVNPDGWVDIAPDGFSYGSTVLALTPNSGPAAGNTSVKVYGYGLGFNQSQIQVSVGGQPAQVTSAFTGSINNGTFPRDQITFTTPPGTPGKADIVITTPVGSAALSGGFHYTQNVQNFPISNTLAELVYDGSRHRVYASDLNSNQVYVFDLNSQLWTGAFTVGAFPVGMALTPDSSRLVVANSGSSSVSIVNVASGTSTQVSLAGLPELSQMCGAPIPYGVATTSNNQAVIASVCSNASEGHLSVLDLSTLAFGCGASQGCADMVATFKPNLSNPLALSGVPDGSKVYAANGFLAGTSGYWDVTSDVFLSQPSFGIPDIPVVVTAAAADGNLFSQNYATLDTNVYEKSVMQDVDYLLTGIFDPNAVGGEKLHDTGALLYVPQVNGIDIYDAHHGHIRQRIVLPGTIAATYDALALDRTGTQLFLVSDNGLTMVQMPELPLSLGSVNPSQGLAIGGGTVTLRGSGFQAGVQVWFGNAAGTVTFVDSSTLQVVTPATTTGSIRITLTNPDGAQYTLDNAFMAN